MNKKVATNAPVKWVDVPEFKLNRLPPDSHLEGPKPTSAFVESVKRYGILSPIIVVKHGRDYQIRAGRRRVKAARLIGLATIPARVAILPPSMIDDGVSLTIVENTLRSSNVAAEFSAIEYLVRQGLTDKEIWKATGLGYTTIRRYKRLLNLDETLMAAFKTGLITSHVAERAARLSPQVQTTLKDKLFQTKHLTTTDVKAAKRVVVKQNLATLPAELFAPVPALRPWAKPAASANDALREAAIKARDVLSELRESYPGTIEVGWLIDEIDLALYPTQEAERVEAQAQAEG